MDQAEFDQFAEEYCALLDRSIQASGELPEFFHEYKVRDVAAAWRRAHPDRAPETILDFGAGVANSLPCLRAAFPGSRIICLDVSPRSLEIAARRFPGQAEFTCFDGKSLPLPAASVSIAFAACVFHHIDHAEHVPILSEFRRVLHPLGLACVYEHNPFNPLTRHAVHSCPFDVNARLVTARQMRRCFRAAGFDSVHASYRFFFPALLRRLRPLERFLTWCPIGAQYYVVGCAAASSVDVASSPARGAA
jgi:ubiquinone/menaquinone biosynthesis C-methylase UbiE